MTIAKLSGLSSIGVVTHVDPFNLGRCRVLGGAVSSYGFVQGPCGAFA
jgi:hypothetical protein